MKRVGKPVGIFDIERTTTSKITREFLTKAEKNGKIKTDGKDLPKSFVIFTNGSVLLSVFTAASVVKKLRNE